MFKKLLCAAALAVTTSVVSAQTVVTFDDAPNADFSGGIGLYGYGGADSWKAIDVHHLSKYAISGDAYLVGSPTIEATFSAPITFVGAYFASWGGSLSGYSYDLYLDDQLVSRRLFEEKFENNSLIWIDSNYGGAVNRVIFYGGGDGVAIDNFTYSAAPVPEPETYAMLLGGLALLGTVVKRRRRT